MKMPHSLDGALFAPCGMNCLVCYKHCRPQKPCAGCLRGDAGKPEHCRKCALKDCVRERGLTYCFQCPEYPCRRLKYLEKSYRSRYGASLMENSAAVKERGLEGFMACQRQRYLCPECGGVISLHDGACSQCGMPDGGRREK